MTKAHATLDDVPGRVPWRALSAFVRHLGPDSALYRGEHPEHGGWVRADAMLADIYDAVQECTRTVAAAHSRKKPRKIKPYPRPWAKDPGTRVIGHGAVSAKDFESFWAEGDRKNLEQ